MSAVCFCGRLSSLVNDVCGGKAILQFMENNIIMRAFKLQLGSLAGLRRPKHYHLTNHTALISHFYDQACGDILLSLNAYTVCIICFSNTLRHSVSHDHYLTDLCCKPGSTKVVNISDK